MRRLAILAHYDAQCEVKRYILEHLRALRPLCSRVVLVSTSPLAPAEIEKAERYADEVALKENRGYDFGAWQSVLERSDLSAYDEVILTNSSVFGPIDEGGLRRSFERMENEPLDVWGMTDNHEIRWHLQSYFLVFRRRVLDSPAFANFWTSILPYSDKFQVIRSYEVGLTTFLTEAGLRGRALVPAHTLFPRIYRVLRRYRRRWRVNPTCRVPEVLVDRGMPYVKVELLRDNPLEIDLRPLTRRLKRIGFDFSLVEFDRAPRPHGLAKLVAKMRERVEALWNGADPTYGPVVQPAGHAVEAARTPSEPAEPHPGGSRTSLSTQPASAASSSKSEGPP
jgi:rhamnosyltransferase